MPTHSDMKGDDEALDERSASPMAFFGGGSSYMPMRHAACNVAANALAPTAKRCIRKTRRGTIESKRLLIGDLHLETARGTTTTSLLELPALGSDVRLLVLVRTKAEVLNSLTGVLLATDKDSVGTSGGTGSELVKGKALTASSLDTSAGSVGETKGSNRELGELKNAVVVSDGADNDNGLGGLGGRGGNATLRLGEVDHARNRNGGLVDLGHIEAAEDGLVEARVSAAGKEAVELCRCNEVEGCKGEGQQSCFEPESCEER